MFVNLLPYWPYLLTAAVAAYLFGSISTAILVTRAVANKDIRDVGSGNAGMTNVLRTVFRFGLIPRQVCSICSVEAA